MDSSDARRGVELKLFAGVTVRSPDGVDLTPRGARSRAVLAILVLAHENCCSRRSLESILWSTRSEEQASASLRQVLSEIRRSLKQHRKLLGADRQSIWLSDLIPSYTVLARRSDSFLADLRIKDPAFQRWISDARSHLSSADATNNLSLVEDTEGRVESSPPQLEMIALPGSGARATLVQEILMQQIAHNVIDSSSVRVLLRNGRETIISDSERVVNLTVRALDCEATTLILLQLIDPSQNRVLWSKRKKFSGSMEEVLEDQGLLQFADEASTTGVDCVRAKLLDTSRSREVDHLLDRALRELFSFDATRLGAADDLLKVAVALEPHPAYIAWRSYVRIPMWVEQLTTTSDSILDDASALLEKALSLGPENSIVHAIASQHYLTLKRDVSGACELAADAIKLNPGNALAHMSAALSQLRMGDTAKAMEAADTGLQIASVSPYRHWWYMASCVVNIEAGNFNAAILNAEAALAFAPKYKSPMRHLYALYIKVGELKKAASIHARIAEMEPFFSLKHARMSQTYPATTLRKSELILLPDVDSVLDRAG